MQELFSYLKQNPIVYITRDIERAFGLPFETDGYYSISNNSLLAKSSPIKTESCLLIDQPQQLSTRELLLDKQTVVFVSKLKDPKVLVFKNNAQIEKICKKQRWNLINPPAAIAKQAEEKISQVDWLGSLVSYLPEHNIRPTKDVEWHGERFILQFNHAHTGAGTALIDSQEDLKELQALFPNRPARCSTFISGPVFTNNNVVTPETTLVGNISYQITGLAPFTDNPFATIGNDWALPYKLLTQDQKKSYHEMAQKIGDLFRSHGWKGLFGIDVIADEKSGKLYLLEINARQPASTAFESELQQAQRQAGIPGVTTFEAHLAALLDLPLHTESLIPLQEGAQIFQRVTRYRKKIDPLFIGHALAKGFTIRQIGNTKIGKELLVIQSKQGMMANHNLFNQQTKELI